MYMTSISKVLSYSAMQFYSISLHITYILYITTSHLYAQHKGKYLSLCSTLKTGQIFKALCLNPLCDSLSVRIHYKFKHSTLSEVIRKILEFTNQSETYLDTWTLAPPPRAFHTHTAPYQTALSHDWTSHLVLKKYMFRLLQYINVFVEL